MTSLSLVRFYQQSFETHPYRTIAFTNGALNGFGDAVAQVAQRVVRQSENALRIFLLKCLLSSGASLMKNLIFMTLCVPSVSFVLVSDWVGEIMCFLWAVTNQFIPKGPFIGRWNLFLENTFPLRALAGTGKVSLKALSKRVAADQLFM